ncbi:sawadee homeodomain homolog 2-like protein [Drosera capensis]
MGRHPSNGVPVFRFTPMEVAQMEASFQEHNHNNQLPAKEMSEALAEQFSKSAERAGKITVQGKQVWNWFQNKRYALRAKMVKTLGMLTVISMPPNEVASIRIALQGQQTIAVPSGGKTGVENSQLEFEAKSARDGAWKFSFALLDSGPVMWHSTWVFFKGQTHSISSYDRPFPLKSQEGKEQALYFDAHVVDAQRRRHDVRGCRCRFLVRYDHDQSEEIVPLRKLCRRPETDHRFHAANESASVDAKKAISDPTSTAYQRATLVSRAVSSDSPAMPPAMTRLVTLALPRTNLSATPGTMAATKANLTAAFGTSTPAQSNMATIPVVLGPDPNQANVAASLGSVHAVQATVNATVGTVPSAGANEDANGTVAPGSMATDPRMVDDHDGIPVPVPDQASMETAPMITTTSEQNKRDVSPLPGFTKLPSANPTGSTMATPSDPMEEYMFCNFVRNNDLTLSICIPSLEKIMVYWFLLHFLVEQ